MNRIWAGARPNLWLDARAKLWLDGRARLWLGTRQDRGFTLIELLVVIIIIGILAAIAIPVFLNQRKKGYDAQAKSDLRNMSIAEETYLTDNPTGYTSTLASLTALGFKGSSNVSAWTAIAHGGTSYCLRDLSQSGTTWYFDSSAAGTSGVTTTVCS